MVERPRDRTAPEDPDRLLNSPMYGDKQLMTDGGRRRPGSRGIDAILPPAKERLMFLNQEQFTMGTLLNRPRHEEMLWMDSVHDDCHLLYHLGLKARVFRKQCPTVKQGDCRETKKGHLSTRRKGVGYSAKKANNGDLDLHLRIGITVDGHKQNSLKALLWIIGRGKSWPSQRFPTFVTLALVALAPRPSQHSTPLRRSPKPSKGLRLSKN
ncbi:hypothetical protein QBC34DRAFT_431516 [Podospora aff. communis PSN243]|uniref:Uncharacterized protein n=1 Tax=Podospora aff. communis PSN243 TaxID=3040156 RepID=A0AAV9G397_9PEZI|nr:hypothetical protein QBC34DRAFT_431516 [Podospora aff. communis PSN243]